MTQPPDEILLLAGYTPEFAASLFTGVDAFFPRVWPSEAQAADAILAQLGCPL